MPKDGQLLTISLFHFAISPECSPFIVQRISKCINGNDFESILWFIADFRNMAQQLCDNREDNPYYEIMHNFFNRQLTLDGNHYFLSKSIKTDVSFLGSHMLTKHPRTSEWIFFQNSFLIDENNKQESFDYLINYFTVSIVAQSFEAFEAFLKDIYRRSLSLQIENAAILNITTKNVRSLKNSEIIKLLRAICPSLSEIFTETNLAWVQAIEKIRHCIVHNDQLIDTDTLKIVKCNAVVNNHFTFSQVDAKYSRLVIVAQSATEILKAFQGLAFSIFVLVSENENYPVSISK